MAPADHSCDVSPRCGSIPERLQVLGLPADLPFHWCHLGPFSTDTVRLAAHDGRGRLLSWRLHAAGGLGRFGGYRLDLLGTSSPPPGVAASYHHLAQLWYVYAVAWRDDDGPRVEWRADRSGPGTLTTHQPISLLSRDGDAVAGRCKELLLGKLAPHRGRPPRTDDDVRTSAQLGIEGETIKARCPRKRWRLIARQLGVDERTLRRARADARQLGLLGTAADGAAETRRFA